jgi:hypothetical protein
MGLLSSKKVFREESRDWFWIFTAAVLISEINLSISAFPETSEEVSFVIAEAAFFTSFVVSFAREL